MKVFPYLKQNLKPTRCSSRSFNYQLAKNRQEYQTHTDSSACNSMTNWYGMILLVSERSLKSPLHHATIVSVLCTLAGSLFQKFSFFMDCLHMPCPPHPNQNLWKVGRYFNFKSVNVKPKINFAHVGSNWLLSSSSLALTIQSHMFSTCKWPLNTFALWHTMTGNYTFQVHVIPV